MSLLKKIVIILSVPMLVIILYFATSKLLMFFPSKPTVLEEKSHAIHILYGDIHTDIVLNLKDLNTSWFQNIHPIKAKTEGYLALGWGDKESYLHPGSYDTIPLSVMFKALFLNSPSLIHVSYHPEVRHYQQLKTIQVSEKQLETLIKNIFKDFDFRAESHQGYRRNNHLYSSPKSYNLINTCNTYTGDKLREVNISMSYWTPLKENVIDSLP